MKKEDTFAALPQRKVFLAKQGSHEWLENTLNTTVRASLIEQLRNVALVSVGDAAA